MNMDSKRPQREPDEVIAQDSFPAVGIVSSLQRKASFPSRLRI